MRSSTFLSAAFAATALAGRFNAKRDYVTEVTWVTVTEYVYIGAEQAQATPAPAPPSYSHKHHSRPSSKAPEPPVYSEPAPAPPASSAAPAPPASSEAPASSAPAYTPPAPAPSSEAPASSAPAYTPPPAPPSSSAAPPAPSTTPASSGSPTLGPDSSYEDIVLAHHNVHRANHSAPDVAWNASLASAAQTLGARCVFKHDTSIGGGGYGQNLAASAPNANVTAQITESWYNGEMGKFDPYYGQATPQVSEEIFEGYGHFTQLVWKESTSIGCATVDCMNSALGMHITVCNYYPPGNFAGKWDKNVIKPRGDKTCNYNDLTG